MKWQAKNIETSELPRVIYLTACAISTALREHGSVDVNLYAAEPNHLALWASLTRGNMLALAVLMSDCISESDVRRGCYNKRGTLRFRSARKALRASITIAQIMPRGPVMGICPLEF